MLTVYVKHDALVVIYELTLIILMHTNTHMHAK